MRFSKIRPALLGMLLSAALAGIVGCGSAASEPKSASQKAKAKGKANSGRTKSGESSQLADKPAPDAPPGSPQVAISPVEKPAARPPDGPKLADLVKGPAGTDEFEKAAIPVAAPPAIDEEQATAAGIRKIAGKILTLYTDLPVDPEVDELPDVFEKAVPQWCSYFGLDQGKAANWKPRAYIMKDKERFTKARLLPADLPPFLHGFQRDSELWVYEQPSAYYRRHLLLHEGTHGFMNVLLGGAGPPWFMEGTAEMLGTHLWKDGRLQLAYVPKDKEELPYWGRAKTIKDETAANRGQTLQEIFAYDTRAHLRPEPYAWCWGATSFLDRHPLSRQAFRDLRKELRDTTPRFSGVFYESIKSDWPHLVEQWQLFVLEQEYGYDVERAAIVYRPGLPLAAGNNTTKIDAARGWQSSGIQLTAGTRYRITSQGRYQIGKEPKVWWCEPGGVTVHYHRGRPLGMLLAAVRSDEGHAKELTPLVKPAHLGLSAEFVPERSGTLYLKINESAADLGDNQGEITVQVSAN